MTTERLRPCFVLVLLATACAREQPAPETREPRDDGLIETKELPAVIVIHDLVPLGFDTTTLYQIEPHFATLNTALVTLAELKRSFDTSADENLRRRLNAYAVPFHLTADTHQRSILRALPPPLDSVFDAYVEARKRAAGLTDWHADHREEGPGTELPGLTPPQKGRQ